MLEHEKRSWNKPTTTTKTKKKVRDDAPDETEHEAIKKKRFAPNSFYPTKQRSIPMIQAVLLALLLVLVVIWQEHLGQVMDCASGPMFPDLITATGGMAATVQRERKKRVAQSPTTNGGMQKWMIRRNLHKLRTRVFFLHVRRSICMLGRCLATKFLRRSSGV